MCIYVNVNVHLCTHTHKQPALTNIYMHELTWTYLIISGITFDLLLADNQ